jgi:hypothetical protein
LKQAGKYIQDRKDRTEQTGQHRHTGKQTGRTARDSTGVKSKKNL